MLLEPVCSPHLKGSDALGTKRRYALLLSYGSSVLKQLLTNINSNTNANATAVFTGMQLRAFTTILTRFLFGAGGGGGAGDDEGGDVGDGPVPIAAITGDIDSDGDTRGMVAVLSSVARDVLAGTLGAGEGYGATSFMAGDVDFALDLCHTVGKFLEKVLALTTKSTQVSVRAKRVILRYELG